jgi:peptidoglycan/xylan/chitin deacetylase (PgdA/CDA1 family)
MSQLLFVNYHYIRDPGQYAVGDGDQARFPGIHPLGTRVFADQIAWLSDHFHMATPAEAEAHVLGHAPLPGPSIVVTFDDGLVDHAPVASVLEAAGIRGVFFLTSRPLVEHLPLAVHKVHWLRATTPPDDFREEFNGLVPSDRAETAHPNQDAEAAAKIYVYDQPADAMLKYRINFRLPHDVVDAVTTTMMEFRGISLADFCQGTYLDAGGVRALQDAGHLVACHGHSHTPFSRLDPDELATDINANLDCLGDILGARPRWVSYPYGRDWAVPDDTAGFCRKFGFEIALTLKAGWNGLGADPTRLNRINTNEVERVAGPQAANKAATNA